MARSKVTISKNPKEVAEALGLPLSKAVEWEARYQLTQKITSIVEKEDWTVSAVARESGTSRARVTSILKGETEGISIDVLLRVLGALGSTVKMTFRKAI